MEYLIADQNRMETGVLTVSKTIDIDIGKDNDCELTVSAEDSKSLGLEYGSMIFSPGTEYGGILADKWSSTSSATVKWYADTWRGMLAKKIVEPPAGLAYRTVSGEANAVIRQLISGMFGDLFTVSAESSGITVSYQIPRYVTLLEAVTEMLARYSARLEIRARQGGSGEPFRIELRAVPVVNYSEELEYSQDNRLSLTIQDSRRGINHLICLGKGELTERLVLHLYAQKDGSIGTTQAYTGVDERTAVYDYSSADDEDTLREGGEERLRELMDYQELKIYAEDVDLEVGDIVAGRDRETGLYVKKPITQKILKVKGLTESITYKVEGEN